MAQKSSRKGAGNTTLTLVLILIIAIIANIFIFGTLKSENTPSDNVNLRTSAAAGSNDDQPAATKPGNAVPENYTTLEIDSQELHFGELILVNNNTEFVEDGTHSVIKHETPEDVYTYKTRDYVILDTTIDLNPTVIEQLNKMFADYVAYSSAADVMINAAYRTAEMQQELYTSKGPDIAAKPGFSEHHSGYAFDICIYSGGVSRTFADEGHYTWIPENCKKYGFIRRYPEGKTDVTGIAFEPWHFRYVGVPHSYYIMNNGIVLEEYIDLLKHYTFSGEHLAINADGKNYEVYYVPAAGELTRVYVPTDKLYTVSGNNTDGFIVTVDMSETTENPAENSGNTAVQQ